MAMLVSIDFAAPCRGEKYGCDLLGMALGLQGIGYCWDGGGLG